MQLSPETLRLLLLLRMVAFLLFMYLVFGLIVETASRDEKSKVRGFARLICGPLTKPVAALMGPEAPYPRVLRNTFYLFGALWLAIFAFSELALAP